MSIFKDTFRPYVRDQLSLREELISLGNPEDTLISGRTIKKSSRNNSNEIKLQSDKKITLPPGAFFNYTTNKQCVIRMTSMVDYVENVGLEIGGLGSEQSFNSLRGAALSQNFILEGGVLSDFARVREGKIETRRVTTPRAGFPKPGLDVTNLSYGDLNLGANASNDGFGIVPMPGITDANIRTKSAYGSLREAKVNFICHSRRQLEVLEMLYMRPGYMVVLEWGWAPYINNEGKLESRLRLLEDKTNKRIYTNNITQQEVFRDINALKEESSGNYDGFLGFVKNFGFKAREDGGFDCYTELVSIGEVLESLKIPSVSNVNVDFNPLEGDSKVPTLADGGTVSNGSIVSTAPNTNSVSSEDFQNALNKGVFPTYNGLEGLIQAINSYVTFNPFNGKNNFENLSVEQQDQIIKQLGFEYIYASDEGSSKEAITQKSLIANASTAAGYESDSIKKYIADLLTYQSTGIEPFLLKKLGLELSKPEELKNYIIPRGLSEAVTDAISANAQGYIRWDALCTLINEVLIPKDDNKTPLNPVSIVTDRVYSEGNGKLRLDPLLFAPITDYISDDANNLLDFSCDPNICILPLQFKSPQKSDDPLNLKWAFGYSPDINVFPPLYSLSVYNNVKSVYYDNKIIDESSVPKLNDTHSNRRIGSIFLNISMLVNLAEKNSDSKDYTLGKFINDIWKEVNKACPNHNFVLTDDKEANTTFIIDLPVDNTEVPENLHEFIPFSNKNILRTFEYTSNVPKAMSATVAIQAQDPRSVEDIDGVTFAAFNRAIKNRILSSDITPNSAKLNNDIANQNSKYKAEQQQLAVQIKNYQATFFRNIRLKDNDKDTLGAGNIKGILQRYQKNSTYLTQARAKTVTFNSVIPLEFNADLDGISGIVIGNIFKVQKDRLPKAYKNANIGFIVFNEDQKITAGGDWVTSIGGKMTILPAKTPKISGLTTFVVADPKLLKITAQKAQITTTNSTTNSLSETQKTITDVAELQENSDVYLKYMIDQYENDDFAFGDVIVTGKSAYYPDGLTNNSENWFNVKNFTGTLESDYFKNRIGIDAYSGSYGNYTQVSELEAVNTKWEFKDGKFGITAVRTQPWVNNEQAVDTDDNMWGVFNSYRDGGLLLGKVKTPINSDGKKLETVMVDGVEAKMVNGALNIPFKEGYKILPEFFQEFNNGGFLNADRALMVYPVASPTKEGTTVHKVLVDANENGVVQAIRQSTPNGNKAPKPDQITLPKYTEDGKNYIDIPDSWVTNIETVWYYIEFNEDASNKFYPGWTFTEPASAIGNAGVFSNETPSLRYAADARTYYPRNINDIIELGLNESAIYFFSDRGFGDERSFKNVRIDLFSKHLANGGILTVDASVSTTNDVKTYGFWMRFDTIAASKESALQVKNRNNPQNES